jgi:hypothetical protein
MSDDSESGSSQASIGKRVKRATGGAFGAGLVLIVFPSAALIIGLNQLEMHSIVGLPVLAIFGIMILFGALALISTVFARLSLSCATEALALPPGSIRAAIALALIVLFALISVMLYQSLSKPYSVEHMSVSQKNALVQEPSNRVLGVIPEPCKPAPPAQGASSSAGAAGQAEAACTPAEMLYTVHLRQSPGSEATDLAKQLLILIGTLMTSVTSFYFAARTTEAAAKSVLNALNPTGTGTGTGTAGSGGTPTTGGSQIASTSPAATDEHADGCDVPIANPTSDVDLPTARGGVAT